MRAVPVLLILLLNSAAAVGHPGHGSTDPSSVVHYVTSPLHVGWMACALVLGSFAAWLLIRTFRPNCARRCVPSQPINMDV